MKPGMIAQGMKVWIHAMGSYYAGQVVKLTPVRALVEYTSGAGKTRQKWVSYDPQRSAYYSGTHDAFPLVDGAQPQPAGARQQRAAP